jgi:hypothetical protein
MEAKVNHGPTKLYTVSCQVFTFHQIVSLTFEVTEFVMHFLKIVYFPGESGA